MNYRGQNGGLGRPGLEPGTNALHGWCRSTRPAWKSSAIWSRVSGVW